MWTRVDEFLPMDDDEVLVTVMVNGNKRKRFVMTACCVDGEWCSYYDEYKAPGTKWDIIAWMPMPKPYTGQIKDKVKKPEVEDGESDSDQR